MLRSAWIVVIAACGSRAAAPAAVQSTASGDDADRLRAAIARARDPRESARAIPDLAAVMCPGQAAGAYAGCAALHAPAELVDDGWLALGDLHFELGQLEPAIAAYGHVAAAPGTEAGAIASYKLGFSYYRLDRFEPAIDAFDRAAGAPAGVVRDESIQYIALSFTEPWSPDETSPAATALARAVAHYQAHAAPHAVAVFEKLGDALVDMTEYAAAADAYRYTIAHWPTDTRRSAVDAKLAAAVAHP